ncbi:hypothetical protein VitviT2T_008072 [Vitis vinifera]|uniref:Malectin-like domain-containing protein n=1 Tax=Vitis vinifera TaxID=29760 RepID=A0ABY9C0V9_VITVI|nr:putative leucine-rich repeat receptor-like serine/threonine-protein kinase At2g14440 [Vitis vinifera]WJZ88803.1 hypothetical protein VitviT2T_008072 [Vitis vinifera]|eukprot:XP_019076034.1 PREDICTED: putative leucine-rich repeat receptor-like serine/threonine-protein kinase At2g14440 [Vitis vinifera]
MYSYMDNNTALYLERRTNYGANQSFPERLSDYYEAFSRFWKPEQVQNYRNFFGKNKSSTSSAENIPPYLVWQSAIEAKNVSDSIFLPINLHDKTQLVAYFVLYFYEPYPWPPANDTRRLIVYIDGERKNITTVPRTELSDDCAVVSVYPVNVTGTANVTISPAEGTTLPPILNAMEVFTTIDFSKADLLPHFYSIFCVCPYLFGVAVWFN